MVRVGTAVLIVLCQLAGSLVAGAGAKAADETHPAPLKGELPAGDSIVTIATRPGVTVRLLIRKTKNPPKGVVVMFPGGKGFIVTRSGAIYLAFRGDFVRRGYATVMMDAPSDRPEGLEDPPYDRFRVSSTYTRDLEAVVGYIRREFGAPIILFGHSMGAISAAHLAATIPGEDIRALVMASSPTTRREKGRGATPVHARLGRIAIPVVLVHHRDDGCSGAKYDEAADYVRLFSAS
ncbi:MAG: hypothetical protein RL477_357, partial [Pseudomonadota bacterium]